jgi:lactate dehydrogenase-like 2-hydroxyacid dehydrogenase
MAKPHLLMLEALMPIADPQLDRLFTVHRLHQAAGKDALIAKVAPDIEAICSFNPAFAPTAVPDSLMARMPKLKVIGHMGVGYDSIDAAAAGKRGVIVTNTPDVLTEEVADTALGLLLMTVRELSRAEDWLRSDKWAKAEYPFSSTSLRGRSVGLVGMGRIGQAIARRIAAFGLPVVYHSRKAQAGVAYRHYPDLVAMARDVDTLLLILPGGAATKDLIDAKVLAALGPTGVLINMARGSVVKEADLIAALHARNIAAAGLDVFQNEPHFNKAFLECPNTVLLPHIGSSTIVTRNAMSQLTVDNLKAWLDKKPPLTPVAETPFKGW